MFSVSAPPLGAASLETHQKARGRNFSAPELRVPFRDERLVTRLDVVREERQVGANEDSAVAPFVLLRKLRRRPRPGIAGASPRFNSIAGPRPRLRALGNASEKTPAAASAEKPPRRTGANSDRARSALVVAAFIADTRAATPPVGATEAASARAAPNADMAPSTPRPAGASRRGPPAEAPPPPAPKMTPDNAPPAEGARDAFSAFFFALLLVARALDASASAASCDFFLSSDSEKTVFRGIIHRAHLQKHGERLCKLGEGCERIARPKSARKPLPRRAQRGARATRRNSPQ